MNISQPSGISDSKRQKVLYSGHTIEGFLTLTFSSSSQLVCFNSFSVRRMNQMIQTFTETQQKRKQEKSKIGNEKGNGWKYEWATDIRLRQGVLFYSQAGLHHRSLTALILYQSISVKCYFTSVCLTW